MVEQRPSRKRGLMATASGTDVLVHDRDWGRFHMLNQTSAIVWRHADGMRDVEEIAAAAGLRLDVVKTAIHDMTERGVLA